MRFGIAGATLLLAVATVPSPMLVDTVAFPFGHATSVPYVASDGNGGFAVSWVDRGAKTFNLAHYDGTKWSKPAVIARGDLLDNRADYPSIAVSGRALVAQWRERAGEGRQIRVVRSSDGGATWSAPVTPHPAMAREFGFVSMLQLADGTVRIAWLDGRASAHEGSGETQLRTATMTLAGTLTDEVLVDGRVCDCCQTSMAMTSRGPLVVYRDRSAKEIRDIVVAAPLASARSIPVHSDGWQIKGCPVNGPRIVARGQRVAVAWFTAASGKPAVNVAFSHDGGATFGAPVRVDAGSPAGRVDLALLEDDSAIVTWVETASPASHIVARRVVEGSPLEPPQTIGSGSAVGFPRIALSKGTILATWNGDDGIRLVLIKPQVR